MNEDMYTTEFDAFSIKRLTIKFVCKKCGTEIKKVITKLPVPNFSAESDSFYASVEQDDSDILCAQCGEKYPCTIQSSMAGSFLYIRNLPSDADVKIGGTELAEKPSI